jgi:hypothetical protein
MGSQGEIDGTIQAQGALRNLLRGRHRRDGEYQN